MITKIEYTEGIITDFSLFIGDLPAFGVGVGIVDVNFRVR